MISSRRCCIDNPVPSGSCVWLVTGHTDKRKGFDGLASLAQDHLHFDPFFSQAFVFRGRAGRQIEKLRGELARLMQAQFGVSSEKLQTRFEQLELAIEA